ncbi:MAG: SOS response-associated peptidase [Bacteroidales bacterium]|nr:SOS response-associated peptidase [Bacteroidales bacterium]
MCGRYVLVQKTEVIEKRFNVSVDNGFSWNANYNISPGTFAPVITSASPKKLQLMQFGLTPFWAKKQMYLFNARAEGDRNKENNPSFTGSKNIINKPSFRKPIRSQRCLVIADAFIEGSAKNGLKDPFLVYLRNKNRPFAFAGIYDIWQNPKTGEELASFSIITTTSNNLMRKIPHDRSPVILPRNLEAIWLNSQTPLTDITSMLCPYDSNLMNAYSISSNISSSKNNSKELINPLSKPLLYEDNISIKHSMHLQGMGARKKLQ